MTQYRPLSAVVLAAGEGTRMRSETPKVLHPLCGRPMLLHVIDALVALPLERIQPTLFGPGLKIFNFHPTFVAANVPSPDYYATIKARWFSSAGGDQQLVHAGRGTRAVLEELAALVTAQGFTFESFEALVDRLPRIG